MCCFVFVSCVLRRMVFAYPLWITFRYLPLPSLSLALTGEMTLKSCKLDPFTIAACAWFVLLGTW